MPGTNIPGARDTTGNQRDIVPVLTELRFLGEDRTYTNKNE